MSKNKIKVRVDFIGDGSYVVDSHIVVKSRRGGGIQWSGAEGLISGEVDVNQYADLLMLKPIKTGGATITPVDEIEELIALEKEKLGEISPMLSKIFKDVFGGS